MQYNILKHFFHKAHAAKTWRTMGRDLTDKQNTIAASCCSRTPTPAHRLNATSMTGTVLQDIDMRRRNANLHQRTHSCLIYRSRLQCSDAVWRQAHKADVSSSESESGPGVRLRLPTSRDHHSQ